MEKILYILTTIILILVYGCNGKNVNNQENKNSYECSTDENVSHRIFFTYKVIRNLENDFLGLAILVNNNGTEEYVLFEDEKNYNKYIYEWFSALIIAGTLINDEYESLSDEKIEAYLAHVHCLPYCMNESSGMNDEIREIILKAYFNWQDVIIYKPQRYYGYFKYPYNIHSSKFRSLVVCKVNDEDSNVPNGTLRIYFKNYFTELIENEIESLYDSYF